MNASHAVTSSHPQVSGRAVWVKLRLFLGLCAISLLAACQTIVPRGEAPQGTAVDPNNVVASDATRHRVALLLPVSGADGDVGQSIANATTLALLDTKNTSIRMTTYDTAQGVTAAAQKAVADGNKLILGPLRGDNVVSVARYARPAGIPIISFSNDIGVAGRDVFLMGHLPGQSIERIVKYARSRGIVNFGGIVTKNVYGQRAMSNLASSVRAAGGRLVSVQEIGRTRSSIDAAARQLGRLGNIDAVLIAAGGRTAMATIPSVRKHGLISAKILGTDRWNVEGSLAGNNSAHGAWFASVADGLFSQYATNYRNRFGKAPIRLSSLGYDSVLLVARVAQNWKVGSRFPTERLTDKGGFIGIDGAFRFLPNGLSDRMLEVQEIRPGQFVTIDAAPKAFAD